MSVALRDHETAKRSPGLRTDPTHWANTPVHSFHRWSEGTTALTWCGIRVDLSAGGAQTTDLISCLACGQASWEAVRGGIGRVR